MHILCSTYTKGTVRGNCVSAHAKNANGLLLVSALFGKQVRPHYQQNVYHTVLVLRTKTSFQMQNCTALLFILHSKKWDSSYRTGKNDSMLFAITNIKIPPRPHCKDSFYVHVHHLCAFVCVCTCMYVCMYAYQCCGVQKTQHVTGD